MQAVKYRTFWTYYLNCGSSRSKHVGKFCPTAHLANVSILLRKYSCWLIFKFYVPDDVSCRTGKEKVQFRKFQVHLENIGGDVVVGGQSAQKFRSRKKKVFYAKTSNPNKHFIAGGTRGQVRIVKRKLKLGKPQLHSTRRALIIINIYNLVCSCLAMDTCRIELLLPPFDRRPFYH